MNKYIQYFIAFISFTGSKVKRNYASYTLYELNFITQQQPLKIYTVVNPCIY